MEVNVKQRIVEAIRKDRENYTSDARHAQTLDISPSVYNRVKAGETEQVLADARWMDIAYSLDVNLRDGEQWIVAETSVYTYITTQLKMCQAEGMAKLLCDLPDVGKTFACKHYAVTHRNVVYVDCSQYKNKHGLVRYIAKRFGVTATGRYCDVYDKLCYYVRTLDNPLIVLDEAGDLHYEAFLELKALWNATEGCCGWYMTGAEGLRAKILRFLELEKVGFAEMFSRYGSDFGRITPASEIERKKFLAHDAAMIIQANAPTGASVNKILQQSATVPVGFEAQKKGNKKEPAQGGYSLRRIERIIKKMKTA